MSYFNYNLRNSNFTLILFSSTFLFNITTLKFVYSIEILSRTINSLVLLSCSIYLVHFFLNAKIPKNIFNKYLFPGILIVLGSSINLAYHSIGNTNILSQLGSLIAWLIFLLIPYLYYKKEINVVSLWRYSYYLMLIIVSLGLVDYYFIYYLSGNADIKNTLVKLYFGQSDLQLY